MNSNQNFVKNLNANDVFTFPGNNTRMVCERRKVGTFSTTIDYRVMGGTFQGTVTKPSMSTVYVQD